MGRSLRRRLEDRVIAAMTEASKSEMQWGRDDCMLWISDILKPLFDFDPGEEWRGRYLSRGHAMALLGKRGVLAVIGKYVRKFQWPSIKPVDAQPGDIGIVKTPIVESGKVRLVFSGVICRKRGWFVGRNETGVTLLAASKVHRAWSVV